MAKPTIQLPDLPDDWFDGAASQPASDTPGQSPGILSGLPVPREWSLADSSLKAFVPPDVMKTIDFSGNAPPELPPWLKDAGHPAADGIGTPTPAPQPNQPNGEGFYAGLTPYKPDPEGGGCFVPG